jgi:hypothetical protein
VIVSPNASWQLYDISSLPREFWLVKDTGHTKALANKNVQQDFLEFLSTDRAYYDANYSSMKIYE